MSIIEKIVEQKILEAIEKGEFDNLAGKGKPIDLNDYFKTPAHLRISYQILKNYGIAPKEVELKKEISILREQLSLASSDMEKKRLWDKMNYYDLLLNVHLDKKNIP